MIDVNGWNSAEEVHLALQNLWMRLRALKEDVEVLPATNIAPDGLFVDWSERTQVLVTRCFVHWWTVAEYQAQQNREIRLEDVN
jgi:hypothetical protein